MTNKQEQDQGQMVLSGKIVLEVVLDLTDAKYMQFDYVKKGNVLDYIIGDNIDAKLEVILPNDEKVSAYVAEVCATEFTNED